MHEPEVLSRRDKAGRENEAVLTNAGMFDADSKKKEQRDISGQGRNRGLKGGCRVCPLSSRIEH